jgi:DNA-binding MarR family transcriptional regulator
MLTVDDYTALAEFRYQIRHFLHFSENAARTAGLNPQQHQLLLALKGLPQTIEPNIGEIAARLHIRHHSAVELTERLVRKGFVRKQRAPADQRRVLLEITARGEAILRRLSLSHRAQLESVGTDLIDNLNKLIRPDMKAHAKSHSNKATKRAR